MIVISFTGLCVAFRIIEYSVRVTVGVSGTTVRGVDRVSSGVLRLSGAVVTLAPAEPAGEGILTEGAEMFENPPCSPAENA